VLEEELLVVVPPPKVIPHKSVFRVMGDSAVVDVLEVVSDELLEEDVDELEELLVVCDEELELLELEVVCELEEVVCA
jgi:hypothetical protein